MKCIRLISFIILAGFLLGLSAACQAGVTAQPVVSQGSHAQYSARMQKSLSANLTATTPTPTISPTPTMKPARRILTAPSKPPGEPPAPSRTLEDTDASVKASEKRVLSGDKFTNNLFERPFTAEEMIYQPDLDIVKVEFASDDDYFYITIRLHGLNAGKSSLTGIYGVEVDRTLTGRGDAIIAVKNASSSWSSKNLLLFGDPDKDVGGPTPLIHDDNFKGNGYNRTINPSKLNIAYARIDPQDSSAVQFAIGRSLLIESRFLWGAWADNGIKKLGKFDYNDTMSLKEAGSPVKTDTEYPIKGIFNFDNTCRLPYGFEQIGASAPGMCITGTTSTSSGDDCYCTSYCINHLEVISCCGQWVCN